MHLCIVFTIIMGHNWELLPLEQCCDSISATESRSRQHSQGTPVSWQRSRIIIFDPSYPRRPGFKYDEAGSSPSTAVLPAMGMAITVDLPADVFGLNTWVYTVTSAILLCLLPPFRTFLLTLLARRHLLWSCWAPRFYFKAWYIIMIDRNKPSNHLY